MFGPEHKPVGGGVSVSQRVVRSPLSRETSVTRSYILYPARATRLFQYPEACLASGHDLTPKEVAPEPAHTTRGYSGLLPLGPT